MVILSGIIAEYNGTRSGIRERNEPKGGARATERESKGQMASGRVDKLREETNFIPPAQST